LAGITDEPRTEKTLIRRLEKEDSFPFNRESTVRKLENVAEEGQTGKNR